MNRAKLKIIKLNNEDVITTSGEQPIDIQPTNVCQNSSKKHYYVRNDFCSEETHSLYATFDIGVTSTSGVSCANEGSPVYGKSNGWYYDDGSGNIYSCSGDHNLESTFSGTYICDDTECFAIGTLITLADGSRKAVENITNEDKVLTWDFEKGEYVTAEIITITSHGVKDYSSVNLTFDDNSSIEIIGGHDLFNATLLKFVNVNQNNVNEYIGHDFVKCINGKNTLVKLISYKASTKNTNAYSIASRKHLDVIANDLLTVGPAIGVLIPFKINKDLKFDEKAYSEDIEKYGLLSYEELKVWAPFVSETQFEASSAKNLKVSIGKGLTSFDEAKENVKKILTDQKYIIK